MKPSQSQAVEYQPVLLLCERRELFALNVMRHDQKGDRLHPEMLSNLIHCEALGLVDLAEPRVALPHVTCPMKTHAPGAVISPGQARRAIHAFVVCVLRRNRLARRGAQPHDRAAVLDSCLEVAISSDFPDVGRVETSLPQNLRDCLLEYLLGVVRSFHHGAVGMGERQRQQSDIRSLPQSDALPEAQRLLFKVERVSVPKEIASIREDVENTLRLLGSRGSVVLSSSGLLLEVSAPPEAPALEDLLELDHPRAVVNDIGEGALGDGLICERKYST